MVRRLRVSAVVAAVVLAAPAVAAAAGPKLAVVDVKRVMDAVPEWNSVVEGLKKDWQKKQAKLEADQDALRKQKEALDNKRLIADPKAIAEEQSQLMQHAQALADTFMKEQKMIAQQEMVLKEQMLRRIEPLVNQIATENDYAYVFEVGTDQAPNVLYAADKIDITSRVVARYKQAFKGKPFELSEN